MMSEIGKNKTESYESASDKINDVKQIDISKRVDTSKEVKTEKNETDRSKDITKRVEPSNQEDKNSDIKEKNLNELIKDYIDDLKSKSDYPETIKDFTIDTSGLKVLTPEQVSEKKEVFDDIKAKLRSEWEQQNHMPWPRYKTDVYGPNGNIIRKAGDCYDAHHIIPVKLGGENVASNITPLDCRKHAEIHSKDGSCKKVVDKVSGGEA